MALWNSFPFFASLQSKLLPYIAFLPSLTRSSFIPWAFGLRSSLWSDAVRSHPIATARLVETAMERGCADNVSAVSGIIPRIYAYSRWAAFCGSYPNNVKDLGGKDFYKTADGKAFISLIAPGKKSNPHLRLCPFAVMKALQLEMIFTLLKLVSVMDNPGHWQQHAKIYRNLESTLATLRCEGCSHAHKKRFSAGLLKLEGWRLGEKEDNLHHFHHKFFQDLMSDQKAIASMFESAPPFVSDQTRFSFIHDITKLMKALGDQGLWRSWVVTNSTMMYALRYGHSSNVTLPSGFFEPSVSDVDIFVHTDRWLDFKMGVNAFSSAYGLSFCGWRPGYDDNQLFCTTGEGMDVEWSLAPASVVIHMRQPSRCHVRHPGVTLTQGWAADSGVTLPCPDDPLQFISKIQFFDQASCFALNRRHTNEEHAAGVIRYNDSMTAADVWFLWGVAVELQTMGFASLAPYFGQCQQHRHATLAVSMHKNASFAFRHNQSFDRSDAHW